MSTSAELDASFLASSQAPATASNMPENGTQAGSTANGSLASKNSDHLKQKRARSQLSCTPCRTGKLKCNREKPACDQCIKRSREAQCIFVPPPAKHKPAQNVKGRIRQLEDMVVDLMNQNRSAQRKQNGQGERQASQGGEGETSGPFAQPTPPSDSNTSPHLPTGTERSQQSGRDEHTPPNEDVEVATPLFGQMRISKSEISYVGESHWGAILDSISDLKRELSDDDDEVEALPMENPLGRSETNASGGWDSNGSQTFGHLCAGNPAANTGLGFMLGNVSAVTKEQLIASVPEKRVADRLLSLWFNSPDPFKPIIHAPTFQEEYKRFWRNPKDVPVMWLGLLYAIMSLAASFGLRDNDPNSAQAQKVLLEVNKYHSLAASAAVLADFTKPKEHTVECLILYAGGLRSNNAFVNVWLMIGLIVRLALRMGYHRDSKHYPNITPFQGEMRRRTWAIISMIDVLISFQLGLPSMVKTIQSDAQPPRNLLDRDFNPSTQALPQSRSINELTPSSYTRAKLRITRIFADAAEMSHATVPPANDEMMKLDRELEEAKAAIPPLLQMTHDAVTDPAEQLMCRFNLDLLYLKTKTVLHRRFMLTPFSQLTPEEQAFGVGKSRLICIACALKVLQHHHTIYVASQPGGQLESVKWYMGSISTHDFLLAAMIICLELSQQIQATHVDCPQRENMMEALEKSQKIWADASRRKKGYQFTGADPPTKGEHIFDETEKAARAMAVMIQKTKTNFPRDKGAQQARDGNRAGDVVDTSSMSDSFGGAAITAMPREGSLAGNTQDAAAEGQRSPFNGVVSNFDWSDMAGVPDLAPDGFDFGGSVSIMSNVTIGPDGALKTLDRTGTITESSSDLSPDQNLDFSMIGNMLDVNSSEQNVDWEMWDSHITKGQEMQSTEWPGNMSSFSNTNESYDMRYSNALAGGTGEVVPGNATIPGGTGAIGGTGAVTIPRGPSDVAFTGGSSWDMDFDAAAREALGRSGIPSGMDFDMNVPLQDHTEYNQNGMYPATAADWIFRSGTRVPS